MTAPELPTDLRRLRVLLVDDNAALRGALRVSLNAFGCAQVTSLPTRICFRVSPACRVLSFTLSPPMLCEIVCWYLTLRSSRFAVLVQSQDKVLSHDHRVQHLHTQ